GWSGTASSSPGVSWENAIRPGPVASSSTMGSPARTRFHALWSERAATVTDGSCHSSDGWGKNMASPAARLTSATGTNLPEIWHDDWPSWMWARSAMAGSSVHPEVVVRSLMSTGAPHAGHVDPAPEDSVRQ